LTSVFSAQFFFNQQITIQQNNIHYCKCYYFWTKSFFLLGILINCICDSLSRATNLYLLLVAIITLIPQISPCMFWSFSGIFEFNNQILISHSCFFSNSCDKCFSSVICIVVDRN
jgi:hypothetical protein